MLDRSPPIALSPARRAAVRQALAGALAGRREVRLALLHGSFQRGEPARDVDVAVWLDPAPAPDGRAAYAVDLAGALGSATGVPVDVQVLNGAALAFRYAALRGEPLAAQDLGFLADLRARAWDEYFDFAPLGRRYLREALDA